MAGAWGKLHKLKVDAWGALWGAVLSKLRQNESPLTGPPATKTSKAPSPHTTTIILRTALEPRPLVPSGRTLRNLKHDLKGVKGKYTLGCVDRDASHIPKENSPQLDWL